jgi:Family of unknown function (DUF6118)
MEQELIVAEDPAARAFNEVRDKLAGLTRAVDSMAGEWKALEIPDYSATLEKIAKEMKVNADYIESLSNKPALQLTPQSLSDAIIKAGAASRSADHAALATATTAFQSAEQSIAKSLASARTAMEQDKRLKKVSINCLIAGMIAGAIFPALISNAMPGNWHLPERMAALAVGTDAWGAGQRLMMFDSPDRWNAIVHADQSLRTNEKVWAACNASARRSGKPVSCAITVKPIENR